MERRAIATATTTTTTGVTTTTTATGTTSTGKLTGGNTVEDGMAAATSAATGKVAMMDGVAAATILAGSAGLGATATTMTMTNGAHGARMDRLPTI